VRSLATLLFLAILFVALPARAFVVPPYQGHVTDAAGKLSEEERLAINLRLEAIQKTSGNHVIVFLPSSLGGETIEDVSYQTFQAWRVGEQALDNGVLLVLAPAERRARIETGKGVGGELTDLQALDIIRTKIKPHLVDERWRDAILDGANAIAATLEHRVVPIKPLPERKASTGEIIITTISLSMIVGMFGFLGYFFLVLLPRRRREEKALGIHHWTGDGSSSWSSTESSSSSSSSSTTSSSSSSGGGSSSGYGGYEGGGGTSGGGGASDSW
jgi:uncharacterized protein